MKKTWYGYAILRFKKITTASTPRTLNFLFDPGGLQSELKLYVASYKRVYTCMIAWAKVKGVRIVYCMYKQKHSTSVDCTFTELRIY